MGNFTYSGTDHASKYIHYGRDEKVRKSLSYRRKSGAGGSDTDTMTRRGGFVWMDGQLGPEKRGGGLRVMSKMGCRAGVVIALVEPTSVFLAGEVIVETILVEKGGVEAAVARVVSKWLRVRG